jgi:hypothetical protein
MGRMTRRLLVAALVVFGAGAAAAQGIFTPPADMLTPPPMATPTLATPIATPTETATATPGTTTSPTTGTTTTGTTTTSAALIEQVVSFARTVEPGATGVSAFTVPAGRQLIVTDVVITNPSASPVCGAGVSPSTGGVIAAPGPALPAPAPIGTPTVTTPGTTTTVAPGGTTTTTSTNGSTTTITGGSSTTVTPGGSTVTTPAGTTAAAVESGTGTLCVPAQTSLTLGLTTGLEFGSGQSVLLANQPVATTPPAATTPGPLFYHLRGFLVSG